MNRKRRSNSQPGDGYQPMSDSRISRRSPTSLTKRSMEAAAKVGIGNDIAERLERAKVILWPFVGDRKAVRCEPNVGIREIEEARRLCGVRDGGRGSKFGAPRSQVRVEHYEMPIAA